MNISFKGTKYTIVKEHPVHPSLRAEGLQRQVTIVGERGAAYLLQMWQTAHGLLYKRISASGRLQVELRSDERLIGGFTVEELEQAFRAVADPDDWKAEIEAWLPGELVTVTVEAIKFYTATVPSVAVNVATMKYFVYSIGYRMGPAGDH